MSGLLNSPHSYDSNFIEATVTNVDPIRFVCAVKTIRGQFYSDVSWLLPTGGSGRSGVHFSPNVGDLVVITTSLSYPIIIGSLPRVGTPETQLTSQSGYELEVDAGGASNLRNGTSSNPNKPSDFAPGDFVLTSEGGGIFSMMANGSTLIKASPLAQVLISKFDDLVRIVARNWERLSDAGQQTVANVNGRLYEFMGWDRDLSRSKVALYELKDIIGDVSAGEILKGEPNPSVVVPSRDSRIRKYSLENHSGIDLMTEVLTDDGKIVVVVHNGGTTTTTHDNSKWESKVVNGTTSTVTILPGSIVINHNDLSIVTLDANKVRIDHKGVSLGYFDDAGVHLEHGGSTLDINASGLQGNFSGHSMTINSSGIHLG